MAPRWLSFCRAPTPLQEGILQLQSVTSSRMRPGTGLPISSTPKVGHARARSAGRRPLS